MCVETPWVIGFSLSTLPFSNLISAKRVNSIPNLPAKSAPYIPSNPMGPNME